MPFHLGQRLLSETSGGPRLSIVCLHFLMQLVQGSCLHCVCRGNIVPLRGSRIAGDSHSLQIAPTAPEVAHALHLAPAEPPVPRQQRFYDRSVRSAWDSRAQVGPFGVGAFLIRQLKK